MATYSPYEGRDVAVHVVFEINLPSDLKQTKTVLHLTVPYLKKSKQSIYHESPLKKLVPSSYDILIPQKHQDKSRLWITEPLLQRDESHFWHETPTSVNDPNNKKLFTDHPLLIYDVRNIRLHKSTPEISNDPKNTKVSIEKRPKFTSNAQQSVLKKSEPIISNKKGKLTKNTPVISNKTPSVLEKNQPLISNKIQSVLKRSIPEICSKIPSKLIFYKAVLSAGKSILTKNDPEMKEVQSQLEQSVPEIHLNPVTLNHPLPEMKDVETRLEKSQPQLQDVASTLEHPKPIQLSTDFDLQHLTPLRYEKEDIYLHNFPILADIPSEFIITTPELEEQ